MEEAIMDPRLGKYINHNLAEYHIPVHADINELDVLFVEEELIERGEGNSKKSTFTSR